MPEIRPDITSHPRPAPRVEAAMGVEPRPASRLGGKRLVAAGGEASPVDEPVKDDILRWTARRRMALVLSILKGETTEEDGARRHGLTVAEIDDWKERVLVAAHNALRSRPRDTEALKDEQIRRLQRKVGELVVDVDLLKEALQSARAPHDGDGGDD